MVVDYLRTLGQWQAMTKLEVKSRYDYSKRKLVPLANITRRKSPSLVRFFGDVWLRLGFCADGIVFALKLWVSLYMCACHTCIW